MNRIFTLVTSAMAYIAMMAATPQLAPLQIAEKNMSAAEKTHEMSYVDTTQKKHAPKAPARVDDADWGTWEEYGTFTFPAYFVEAFNERIQWIGQTCEWNPQCKVMRRISASNPDRWQLMFTDIFNHADFLMDYDRTTTQLHMDYQSTNIPGYGGDGYYEFLHFGYAWGNFFEASHLFQFGYVSLNVAENLGYHGWADIETCMDGYTKQTVGLGPTTEYLFSSTQTSGTINVKKSSEVESYRVVTVPLDSTIHYNPYYVANPDASELTLQYTESSEPTFTFNLTDEPHFNLYVFPIGKDNIATAPPVSVPIYHNIVPSGTWKTLGTATMRDFISYNGIEYTSWKEEAIEQQVEIEYMVENPSVYRIRNAFGKKHPLYPQYINPYPYDDDTYLVIDATDPSKVNIPRNITDFEYYGWDLFSWGWHYDKNHTYSYENYYGKCVDKRITFGPESIFSNVRDVEYLIQIDLPGYEEYAMQWINDGNVIMFDGGAVAGISGLTQNIASVDYALISEELYAENSLSPEKIIGMLADRSSELASVVKTVSVSTPTEGMLTLSFTNEEIPYGVYRFVALSRDKDGNSHTGIISEPLEKILPLEQWTSLGTARLKEYLLLAPSTAGFENTVYVEVRENPTQPGVYCIVDLWKTLADEMGFACDTDIAQQVYLSCVDPENIFITDNMSGLAMPYFHEIETGMAFYSGAGKITVSMPPYAYGQPIRYINGSGNVCFDFSSYLLINLYEEDNIQTLGSWNSKSFSIEIGYDPANDPENPDNWKSLGTATVEENILFNEFDTNPVTFSVEIRENPSVSGLYCLVNPYKEWNKVSINGTGLVDDADHHLFINASDDSFIHFSDNPQGTLSLSNYEWKSGLIDEVDGEYPSLLMMANLVSMGAFVNNDQFNIFDYVGQRSGQELILDNCLWYVSMKTGNILPPESPRFRVMLPGAGTDAPMADENNDSPVEYFNLQGMKVDNPGNGIFIRRQGNKVSKITVK